MNPVRNGRLIWQDPGMSEHKRPAQIHPVLSSTLPKAQAGFLGWTSALRPLKQWLANLFCKGPDSRVVGCVS